MRLLLLLVERAGRDMTKAVVPCSAHARRRRLAATREAGKRNMM